MKFLALIFISLAVSANGRRLEPVECQYNQFILAMGGVCPAPTGEEACFDFCTYDLIESERDCAASLQCCWTGEKCVLKEIPVYVRKTRESGDHHEEEEEMGNEMQPSEPEEKSRKKRQSGSWGVEHSKNAGMPPYTRLHGSWRINDKSSITGGVGKYHPGPYDANIGYNRKLWGGTFNAGASYRQGQRGLNYGLSYTRRFG